MKTDWYKFEYEAWDEGTEELTLEQEAAYLRFCNMMHRRRGPFKGVPKSLARVWRCHPNKAKALLRQLIEAKKIIRLSDGRLSNERVTTDLHRRHNLSTTRAHAANKRWTQRKEKIDNPLETEEI